MLTCILKSDLILGTKTNCIPKATFKVFG